MKQTGTTENKKQTAKTPLERLQETEQRITAMLDKADAGLQEVADMLSALESGDELMKAATEALETNWNDSHSATADELERAAEIIEAA